jgi:hypothetical protein
MIPATYNFMSWPEESIGVLCECPPEPYGGQNNHSWESSQKPSAQSSHCHTKIKPCVPKQYITPTRAFQIFWSTAAIPPYSNNTATTGTCSITMQYQKWDGVGETENGFFFFFCLLFWWQRLVELILPFEILFFKLSVTLLNHLVPTITQTWV